MPVRILGELLQSRSGHREGLVVTRSAMSVGLFVHDPVLRTFMYGIVELLVSFRAGQSTGATTRRGADPELFDHDRKHSARCMPHPFSRAPRAGQGPTASEVLLRWRHWY
jgi:hypothetical protein